MTILYEGMLGSAANPTLGWILILSGAIVLITFIILGITYSISDGFMCFVMAICIAAIIIGIFNLIDSRIPIIKATLNDTVSYEEINDKYTLRTKEGELYTFEVKNVTPDEWELHLNK